VRLRARLSALGAAVGLSLAHAESLDSALQQCAEALVEHLGAASARVWTLNEHDGVLEPRAVAGLLARVEGSQRHVPLGEAGVGRIAREGKPYLTNRVVGDARVSDQAWAEREGMIAFAGYPLLVDGRLVGAMSIFAREELGDAAIAKLGSVADHSALGIERHRAVDALRTAEERMRFALESANVGIWEIDYTSGAMRWSETLEAHYGLAAGTFRGTWEAFLERVHPDDRGALEQTIEHAAATGGDFSVQNRTVWPDGTVRSLSGAGRVLVGDDGRPLRGVGISIDVTERRSLEERYQQAQRMEAIGRLAGGVAHDFNNVLTVVNGYSELLMTSAALDADSRELVQEIATAGDRAASLTRQLLAFSRKQVLETRVMDLNLVVARAEAMLQRVVGEDVALTSTLAPSLFPVRADPGQIEQIIMNLVVNARDAMPRGGSLTLETANLEVAAQAGHPESEPGPGRHVMLAVTDTGGGMTREVLAHLFEPFFSTKGSEGTGLGLATVHGIVKQSGGSVRVQSEPGKGTTFRVYLPAAADDALVVVTGAGRRAVASGSETVLLVEDEEGVRALCRLVLQSCGYNVLAASGAAEALELAAAHAGEVGLLLTDVVMPELGGRLLAQQVEALCPGLAVLYMSGYTDDTVLRHGVLAADTAFLQKPFTPAALAGKVRQVLDGVAGGGPALGVGAPAAVSA
jgi:two-component system, cell cycle sensor histidine kinase and response regulator CckA